MEYASTYIKSETRVKDFQLEKDLIDAYANATVRVIQELERTWYKDSSSGDCFKIKVKPRQSLMNKRCQNFPKDKGFDLEVTSPFGSESIMVYGSNANLGEIDVAPVGGVYQIKTSPENIGKVTRGITLKAKSLDEKGRSQSFPRQK